MPVEYNDEVRDLRWNRSAFFVGGATKNPTLVEAHDPLYGKGYGADATDKEIASEILNRAAVVDRPWYPEMLEALTDFLAGIDDPRLFVNPHYGITDAAKEQEKKENESPKTRGTYTPAGSEANSSSAKGSAKSTKEN